MMRRRLHTYSSSATLSGWQKPPYLVFISHASEDLWVARQMKRQIEERIEKVGGAVFLDESNIQSGDYFVDKIVDAIQRSTELVVLITPESIQKEWVMAEIGAALSQRMRIVAVLYKVPFEEMPDLLAQRKAIPLNDFDEYLSELEARVRERP